jgi:hypothetical protein
MNFRVKQSSKKGAARRACRPNQESGELSHYEQ